MYAIRSRSDGLWYNSGASKQWIQKLDRDSLFWTKRAARVAMNIFSFAPSAYEIVAVEIVEKTDPRIVEQS